MKKRKERTKERRTNAKKIGMKREREGGGGGKKDERERGEEKNEGKKNECEKR